MLSLVVGPRLLTEVRRLLEVGLEGVDLPAELGDLLAELHGVRLGLLDVRREALHGGLAVRDGLLLEVHGVLAELRVRGESHLFLVLLLLALGVHLLHHLDNFLDGRDALLKLVSICKWHKCQERDEDHLR